MKSVRQALKAQHPRPQDSKCRQGWEQNPINHPTPFKLDSNHLRIIGSFMGESAITLAQAVRDVDETAADDIAESAIDAHLASEEAAMEM